MQRQLNILLVSLITVVFFHPIWGSCVNTTGPCNLHQTLVLVDVCFMCVCDNGFFQHHGLASCEPCTVCKYPDVVIRNCTGTMDTECGHCQKGYYHDKGKCQKCTTCAGKVLTDCMTNRDTVCGFEPTTANKTAIVENPSSAQTVYHTAGATEKFPFWFYFSVSLNVVFGIIGLILVARKICCLRRYGQIDQSSLATNSVASLMFNLRSKHPDISALTIQERSTLIRDLPGGYVDILGERLNPRMGKSWVQLAYELRFTHGQVENIRLMSSGSTPEYFQHLMIQWECRNTATVEALFYALKKIRREDACTSFLDFLLSLRNDNESC